MFETGDVEKLLSSELVARISVLVKDKVEELKKKDRTLGRDYFFKEGEFSQRLGEATWREHGNTIWNLVSYIYLTNLPGLLQADCDGSREQFRCMEPIKMTRCVSDVVSEAKYNFAFGWHRYVRGLSLLSIDDIFDLRGRYGRDFFKSVRDNPEAVSEINSAYIAYIQHIDEKIIDKDRQLRSDLPNESFKRTVRSVVNRLANGDKVLSITSGVVSTSACMGLVDTATLNTFFDTNILGMASFLLGYGLCKPLGQLYKPSFESILEKKASENIVNSGRVFPDEKDHGIQIRHLKDKSTSKIKPVIIEHGY